MKLIVGLGNPGAKYKKTRHNLGHMVLDFFASENGLVWKLNPDWMCFFVKTRRFVLMKPVTYMNKSGESVLAVSNYYKIEPEDILVIYDDMDLPFGKLRLAVNGVSAGHHGIDSVIESLGGVDFDRLRVGIGRPSLPLGEKASKQKNTDYVLKGFAKDEAAKFPKVLLHCQEALNSYLDDGIGATMNRFN